MDMNPYQPPRRTFIKRKASRSFVSVALGVVFGALVFLWSSPNLFVGIGATQAGSYAAGYIGGSLLIGALSAYLICYGFKTLEPA